MGAWRFWAWGSNCNSILCIAPSGLLLVDGAAVACREECERNNGGPHCGSACYLSKLKADSG